MIDDNTYPITSGKVVIKKRGEKYVIKDLLTTIEGKANEDLRDLLVLCDGTRTVNQIIEELSANYEELPKGIRKKVVKSLEFLKDLRFLEFSDTPGYAPLLIKDADSEWPLDMAYLEVTNRCNLKCIHCYKDAGDPLGSELTTEEWLKVIDTLREMGVFVCAVTGGEPFLREDISDILKYAARDMSVNVFTNGILVTEETIELLKGINPERVIVSLDGVTRESHERIRGKNTFEKTVETIKLLTEGGLRVRINSVIYTQNIKEIEKLIPFLLTMGVREIILDRFMGEGRGGRKADLIPPLEMGGAVFDQYKKFEKETTDKFELKFTSTIGEADSWFSYCGVGTSMVTVKANGDVVLCPVLSGPEYTAGNMKKTPLKELWLKSTLFKPFRECTTEDTVCGTCSHKQGCRGGCKARALQHYGKVCMPDPWMCATRGQKWP